MKVSLDALLVIDAIARYGSFSAAAEKLHRVPSALSYSVRKIERDLGIQVFDRSHQRARLTPEGETLLREGRHLLQAAAELEALVERAAKGWETELCIAVSELIPLERLLPFIDEFHACGHSTRIRLTREVLGGNWEALIDQRADLLVGAPLEERPFGDFRLIELGRVPFVFVVPPHHPLAAAESPLSESEIIRHRAIAVADSARRLLPRTVGLAGTQDVLTLPDMESKCQAHRAGLGIGYVPRHYVAEDLERGLLVQKEVANGLPAPAVALAWRDQDRGRALAWFIERLGSPQWLEGIIQPASPASASAGRRDAGT